MKLARIALALVLCLPFFNPVPASADHDNTCHPPDPPTGGWFIADSFSFGVEREMKEAGINLQVIFQRDRVVRGILELPGGQVLVAEPGSTRAACADVDNDGIAGLTSFELLMSDSRTGESLLVIMLPTDGEIDRPGWAPMTVVLEGFNFPGRALVR